MKKSENARLRSGLALLGATLGPALLLLSVAGCALDSTASCEGDQCEELATAEEELFPDALSIWRQTDIPVCWESPSASHATQRAWVQDAVTKTWDTVTRVNFTGWGTCAATSKGIRIKVADVKPETHLGRGIAGLSGGMVLNFTYKNYDPTCAKKLESCIRPTAVHEFGHALGFVHEQNRSDKPDWCKAEDDFSRGTTYLGPWDDKSIMNYCNSNIWLENGKLSDGDIKYSRLYYGDPTQDTSRRDIVDWGNGKAYYFNKSEYTRYDIAKNRSDNDYPKPIMGNWNGWPAAWSTGIDAAANLGNGLVYFFRGSQFLVFSIPLDMVIINPTNIVGGIPGWPATWTSVDAAMTNPAGAAGKYWDKKVYFFRGSEYLRFNVAGNVVDVLPKPISVGWPGVFTSGINYGFMKSNKAIFFKGTQHSSFNMSMVPAEEKLDAGFPKIIMGYYPGLQF